MRVIHTVQVRVGTNTRTNQRVFPFFRGRRIHSTGRHERDMGHGTVGVFFLHDVYHVLHFTRHIAYDAAQLA